MNSKHLLLQRQSTPQLTSPAPKEDDLNFILSAGMRVPDHGALTPWFFTIAQEEGLNTLSDIFEQVAKDDGADEIKVAKAKKMPFRAPLIIIVSTQYQPHEKVPQIEQAITAGCSVHSMQMAAFSLGYGAMWRTGDFSYHPKVKAALQINPHEHIVGFLYIGTPSKELPIKPLKSFDNYVRHL